MAIDAAHIERQREFSLQAFGPGLRTEGILAHIASEFEEVRADPTDVKEWVDIIILGLDGAHRTGAEPQAIIDAIEAKQAINESRVWADWRTADPEKPIEHDRTVPDERPDRWEVVQLVPGQPVHVIPIGDPPGHVENSFCDCDPAVEDVPRDDGSSGLLVTHNAYDGRD